MPSFHPLRGWVITNFLQSVHVSFLFRCGLTHDLYCDVAAALLFELAPPPPPRPSHILRKLETGCLTFQDLSIHPLCPWRFSPRSPGPPLLSPPFIGSSFSPNSIVSVITSATVHCPSRPAVVSTLRGRLCYARTRWKSMTLFSVPTGFQQPALLFAMTAQGCWTRHSQLWHHCRRVTVGVPTKVRLSSILAWPSGNPP